MDEGVGWVRVQGLAIPSCPSLRPCFERRVAALVKPENVAGYQPVSMAQWLTADGWLSVDAFFVDCPPIGALRGRILEDHEPLKADPFGLRVGGDEVTCQCGVPKRP